MRPRQEDRERLEQDLPRRAYQTLLRTLQRTHRFLRRFQRWADVIAFMRNGTSTDPRKDEVLRAIFEAHAQGQDPRWRVILHGDLLARARVHPQPRSGTGTRTRTSAGRT